MVFEVLENHIWIGFTPEFGMMARGLVKFIFKRPKSHGKWFKNKLGHCETRRKQWNLVHYPRATKTIVPPPVAKGGCETSGTNDWTPNLWCIRRQGVLSSNMSYIGLQPSQLSQPLRMAIGCTNKVGSNIPFPGHLGRGNLAINLWFNSVHHCTTFGMFVNRKRQNPAGLMFNMIPQGLVLFIRGSWNRSKNLVQLPTVVAKGIPSATSRSGGERLAWVTGKCQLRRSGQEKHHALVKQRSGAAVVHVKHSSNPFWSHLCKC